jgi:hypothetical protein
MSTEAERLLAAAGKSLPKLRVLTVICAKDHNLINVYRIGGMLVWRGTSTKHQVNRSTPRDDSPEACDEGINHGGRRDTPIRYSKFSPQERFVIVELLEGAGQEPCGNCPCGNFVLGPEWLTEQLERVDLPASRRVVREVR